MVFQSVTTACPWSFFASGPSISPTRSASAVLTSIMPIEIAGQQQGLRVGNRHDHERLVVVVDADLEDRAHGVADLPRDRAERGRPALWVDDRDRIAEPRAEIGGEARADRDVVLAVAQRCEIADQHVGLEPADVLRRVAAHEYRLDPAVERRQQRLLDQRRGAGDLGCLAHLIEHLLPVLQPAAIGLDDRVAVEPDDLVEQLGAEAVHHAHDDDQHRHREHDHADADRGDERDHRLAAPGQHVTLGDGPFERGEDQESRFAVSVVWRGVGACCGKGNGCCRMRHSFA